MKPHSPALRFAAWATHAFTASGMVAGLFALLFISEHQYVEAFLCLTAALVIDGVDGSFARMFRVKEVLPHVSGRDIDYVVDFANYALIPAYFLYVATYGPGETGQPLLPEGWAWLAVSILLVSVGIYYGKEGMVSEDMHFVGFPALWNVLAFYLYFVLQTGPWVNFAAIIFCAVAQFLPLKFAYPSRARRFRWLHLFFTLVAVLANLALLLSLYFGWGADWLRWPSLAALGWFVFAVGVESFFPPNASKP